MPLSNEDRGPLPLSSKATNQMNEAFKAYGNFLRYSEPRNMTPKEASIPATSVARTLQLEVSESSCFPQRQLSVHSLASQITHSHTPLPFL